jgi:hypothetical protein
VTDGIRAASGQPLSRSEAFGRYQTTLKGPDDRWYRKTLAAAEWAARRSTRQPQEIDALSSFTTQSVTYLREKITKQILAASPPAAADFNVLPGGDARSSRLTELRPSTTINRPLQTSRQSRGSRIA